MDSRRAAHEFACPLRHGLHARPASLLAEEAARFAAEITFTNLRTGAVANARSVIALVALDVRDGDACRLQIAGADAAQAEAALRAFVRDVLPGVDAELPAPAARGEVALPRALRNAGVRWLAGTVACPGLGRGVVVVAGGLALPADVAREPAGTKEHEQDRVRRAVAAVTAALHERLAARPGAVEAGILRAHLAIAGDVELAARIAEEIAAGRSAGAAVAEAARFFAARLAAADSAWVRERAVDVEDIGGQLLEQLDGDRMRAAPVELTQPSVVVAENLAPRQLLAMDRRFLAALVLQHAGPTSHAVILARSFGIPTLTHVPDVRANLPAGREVIVDGGLGLVIPELSEAVRRHYERDARRLERRERRLVEAAAGPALTLDGVRLEVSANVSSAAELEPAFARGADGIGLFRTEMLFLDRDAPPSEEEQFAVYAAAARAAAGRPVIIRTFDVGGDKPAPYLRIPLERNPFLGLRGVRVYPLHRELLVTQLRAILRASALGRVWILLPMVGSLDEVRWVKAVLAEVRAGLDAEGLAHDPAVPLGIMIEVPSAALLVAEFAAEVEFFSLGTNDLSQYVLAVDRGSDTVGALCSPLHPAFLRLLDRIVGDARRARRWIGLCGEMARDVAHLPLLVGLQLDEISTAAPGIPELKAAVGGLSAEASRELLAQALACATVGDVERLLASRRQQAGARGLLDGSCVVLDSQAASKDDAIAELADALFAAGRTDRPDDLEDAVWAREVTYSTGLGFGFAIPHCKSDAVSAGSLAVLRPTRPIEWGSADGEPVRCVILLALAANDPQDTHMKVFSTLARRLMHEDFRARLLAATDRGAVLRCLCADLGLTPDLVA